MVTVVGAHSRSAQFADLISNAQGSTQDVQKSVEEDFKNTYLTSILGECSSDLSKVNSFKDFSNLFLKKAKADYYYSSDISKVQNFSVHREKADYLNLTEADCRKEFVKYCESCGCYSEKELQTLSITGLANMVDLNKATASAIKDISMKLVDMGNKDCELIDEEVDKVVSTMNYDDMAYLNDPKRTDIQKLQYFQKFLKKVVSQKDIAEYFGKALTDKLTNMPKAIDSLVEKIIKDEKEKELHKREAEKNSANVEDASIEQSSEDPDAKEKYNASLISKYAA